jgi:hypothetical protein
MSGNEHLIVSIRGEIGVVQAAFYHLLPDSAKPRIKILATCPSGDLAWWLRSHLPRYFDVGDLIRNGARDAQR